jgi:hypothetical protein
MGIDQLRLMRGRAKVFEVAVEVERDARDAHPALGDPGTSGTSHEIPLGLELGNRRERLLAGPELN